MLFKIITNPFMSTFSQAKNGKPTNLSSNQESKSGKVTDMGNGETFSKFYVPPARREFNNIGLSTYFDWKFKVCIYV